MGTQGPALPLAKSVTVYRNGDPFFAGRRFVVNRRQVANLECFLGDVTRGVGAPVAVRALYTPGAGHRVRELQDLRAGGGYVAAGFERFKKLDYANSGPRPAVHRDDRAQVRTVQRPNVSAKWRKAIHLPCIIHVFRNGDLLYPPLRFIIPRSALQDLEKILTMVSEKAGLRTGAVRRLCTLEGGAVSAGEQLESGQYYVAVGTERFKNLPYLELLYPKAAAAHVPRHRYGDLRLPKRYESSKPVSVPQDRYSDSTLLDSPEGDGRRVKSTGDEAGGPAPTRGVPRKQGGARKEEEESLFFAKPAKVHKNKPATRYSQPLRGDAHPSVFKGDVRKRRKEVQGAEEVAEDEDTAVEFPVDQRAAEMVDEQLADKRPVQTPRAASPALQRERRAAEIVEDAQLDHKRNTQTPRADSPDLQRERRPAEPVEDEEPDHKRHAETPRGDGPDLQREREKTSAEPRFEVGYETNGRAPASHGQPSGRDGSVFNEDKQEPAPPHSRDSARRSPRDSREETVDDAREESSLAVQETTRPNPAAESLTYCSQQDSPDAGRIQPDSRLSMTELAT